MWVRESVILFQKQRIFFGISYTGMSRLVGLRYTGIHDTSDIFHGRTPDQCFRSLCTRNSDFPVRSTSDNSGATSVTSCARKIFREYHACRFEPATFGKGGVHRITQGIMGICMYRLSTYLIVLVLYYANCFFVLFLTLFLFFYCNFLIFFISLFLFIILYCFFVISYYF